MEPLFRFVLNRPPVAQDPANPSIRLTQDSPYQIALRRLDGSGNREGIKNLAIAFIENPQFIGGPEETPLGKSIGELADKLDALEREEDLGAGAVAQAITSAFGKSASALAGSDDFKQASARLRDSITAIKQVPAEHGRPLEALTRQLRTIELVEKVSGQPDFPANAAALKRYRRRSLELPSKGRLPSSLPPSDANRKKADEEREKQQAERTKAIDSLVVKHRELSSALHELTQLDGPSFEVSVQEPSESQPPTAGLELESMLRHSAAFSEKLSGMQLKHFERLIEAPRDEGPSRFNSTVPTIDKSSARLAASAGAPAVSLVQFRKEGLRLAPEAVRALSEQTRKTLAAGRLSAERDGIENIVAALTLSRENTQRQLQAATGPLIERRFRKVGNTLVATKTAMASLWNQAYDFTELKPSIPFIPFPAPASVPTSRGKVSPAGVADLLMVRQQLIGYERADVAHIENVLKGEGKEREHTTRRETEELTFVETEVSTSEERELETTDRFEMTRESNQTIKEDASLKAGLTVSGKYGPTVEFTASAEGSTSRSKEEATKSASSFSQDVTQRSSNKISERVLERSSLRVTNEVTEKNLHKLDNVGGTGHISGVYQWVNKVYQAQMFNYGLRTMFDFMVPEPAAFLIKAMQMAHESSVELEKPEEFILTPNEITEVNYGDWVAAYSATDVNPPPEMYKTKAVDFKATDEEPPSMLSHSGQIVIDDGYEAITAYIGTLVFFWADNWKLFAVVGNNFLDVSMKADKTYPTMRTVSMSNETGSVPFALITNRVASVGFSIEVKCKRSDRALAKWRAETHAKLTTAYRARLGEYEEKLASIEMQAGVAIRGANPALNLERMKDELKKDCISIITDQHYDLFNAIDTAPSNGMPQIDISEAAKEGAYVRFFEQAFEWEHLTWVTYPYFWGRKNQWDERLSYDDPDPLFTQFLKAGYCRVSVPARLGFEGAIDHFLTYGELWEGGPLPTISSPLYLAIADEIAERLDRPGDEIPQGDPWTVRIPTSLVHLRPDDKLPKWVQNPEGEWVEA